MAVSEKVVTGQWPARVRAWLGRHALLTASAGFIALGFPVIWRGAPLADDFTNCLRPAREGLAATLTASWARLGAVRPARFVEILLTNGVCEHLPFGVAIAVPLALTVAVAWLLRGLLCDLDVPGPWPDVAGVVWLLQPLGTEAALWPAALHVPLGLVFALAALRLLRRGRLGSGIAAAVGAFASAEQTILALPIATWITMPAPQRRRATAAVLGTVAVVGVAFLVMPGHDERLQAGIAGRLAALVSDPAFYAQFPAVGLGAHSIPLAVWWALPWSLLLLGAGAAAGWWLMPRQDAAGRSTAHRLTARDVAVTVALVVAVNAPVLSNVPRQGSPRVFVPTWLLMAALLAVAASRVHPSRPRPVGALAGLTAVGAVLSLVLSVSVRLDSADVVEAGAHHVAAQTTDGDVVALCEVPRTAVEPAPRGAFAVHDFLYDWAAADAIAYHTGRDVTVHVHPVPCHEDTGADLELRFEDLRTERDGAGS